MNPNMTLQTPLSMVASGLEDMVSRQLLPAIADGLATKGYNVSVEELMSMIKIAKMLGSNQSSGLTPMNQVPLLLPQPFSTGNGNVGNMGLISQSQATSKNSKNNGRKPGGGIPPRFKCFYLIRPNNQGGQERRCEKSRAENEYFCKACSSKNKGTSDFTAGKLDEMIRAEMGEEYTSTRVRSIQNQNGQSQNGQNQQNIFSSFKPQPQQQNMFQSSQPLGSIPNMVSPFGNMSNIPSVSQNMIPLQATQLNGYPGVLVMNNDPKFIFRKIDDNKLPITFAKLSDTTTGKVIAPLSDQDKKLAMDLKFEVTNSDPNGQVKVEEQKGLGLFNPQPLGSTSLMPNFPTLPNLSSNGFGMPSFPTVSSFQNIPNISNTSNGLPPPLTPLHGFGGDKLVSLSSTLVSTDKPSTLMQDNSLPNISSETTSKILSSSSIDEDGIPGVSGL